MGPSHLWKGCPFVAILNSPGQPSQSAPFLLTFSSALIGGRIVTDPSHQEPINGGGVCDRDAAGFLVGREMGSWHGKGQWKNWCRRNMLLVSE